VKPSSQEVNQPNVLVIDGSGALWCLFHLISLCCHEMCDKTLQNSDRDKCHLLRLDAESSSMCVTTLYSVQ